MDHPIGIIFAAVFCASAALPARAADPAPLDSAKKSQATRIQQKTRAQLKGDLLDSRTKDLSRMMEGIVSELETKGIQFQGVQGDSKINPLPEILKGKVGLERHRKQARVILRPKGDDGRIFLELAWTPATDWDFAIKLTHSDGGEGIAVPGKDLRVRHALQKISPQVKEAVLKLIGR